MRIGLWAVPFVLGQWFLSANPACPADIFKPAGLIGTYDSLGCNEIRWVYPGFQATIYSIGSNSRLKGMYISNEPGAHQLACRFALSPSRQIPEFAEIWVEKGREYSLDDWSSRASLRIGLFTSVAGVPGNPLNNFKIYTPAAAGIPPEGGYLRVDLLRKTPALAGDTVWLIIEWPAEFPDLVWIGVDCEPASFNAMYRVGGLPTSDWQLWTLHNFMVRLGTLGYSEECGIVDGESGLENEGDWIERGFAISRYEIAPDGREIANPDFAQLSGAQLCFTDTTAIVDHFYEYEVRAICSGNISEPAAVTIASVSQLSCGLAFLETDPVIQGEQLRLPYFFNNYDIGPLEVIFLNGWLKRLTPSDCPDDREFAADSLALWAEKASRVFSSHDSGEIFLRPETEDPDCGIYEVWSLFRVRNAAGTQATYMLGGTIEIIAATETTIWAQPEADTTTPLMRLFPNPGREQITVELFIPECSGFESPGNRKLIGGESLPCGISILNILGREVFATEYDIINVTSGRYDVLLDCRDKCGNQLPSGVYFVTVRVKELLLCRKLMIIH